MGRKRSKEAQRCLDALMRGDFKGSDEPYKDAVVAHGKGKVDTHNLRKMYLTACKTGKGKRPVSAALQTATEAGQRTEVLEDCIDAASTHSRRAKLVGGACVDVHV